MKVLHINICGNLSTGNIASDIIRETKKHGGEGVLAYARNAAKDDIQTIVIGTRTDVYLHAICSRITDRAGFYSAKATEEFIKKIEELRPDLIHLHNLHGYYIHVGILFDFLKRYNKPIAWTLHDCWAFTGHCPYFTAAGCDKWETGCHDCPEKKNYPASILLDNSVRNYADKKKLFSDVPGMVLVTPSEWLKQMVGKSFLKDYPCRVIYNGIDASLFYPRAGENFRKKYHIENRKILLGVASTWSKRKGYSDFCELSKLLPESWITVMVGLKPKQIEKLPAGIIGVERTKTVDELAQIYSEADLYFNASVEETMGLTTVEAIFCGTPAVVYDSTAVPECVETEGAQANGYVVPQGDIAAVAEIVRKLDDGEYRWLGKESSLMKKADFLKEEACGKYYELYQDIMGQKTE